MTSFTCKLLLLTALVVCASADSVRKKKVLLRNGMAITFQKGEICQTNKNPDPRFPKLQCEGSNCNVVSEHVNTLQCKSEGIDDMGTMNWRCTGEIPKGCHFSSNQVSCEGFDGLDSEYIVPGSCGLIYSLNCDRIDAAQAEETALRNKVKTQRQEQQQLAFKRVAEIQGKEAADKCELAVAGALHQPGNWVEMRQWNDWVKGAVSEVACDGSYTFQPDHGASKSRVEESQLRTWVATIYKEPWNDRSTGRRHRAGASWTAEDSIAERCGFPLCNGHGACRSTGPCECEKEYYGEHCESKQMSQSELMITLAIGIICVVLFLMFGGSKQGKGRQGKEGVSVPGGRQVDNNAMDQKRAALDKIKATQAKLRIAKVKAKQDVERLAALDKYDTEMDQLQRDVQNDTAQLGNVMERVDHVLDRYEAVGYATTEMR